MDATREEILIDRLIDGTATDGEWREFELHAVESVGGWERLARGFRCETVLHREARKALTAADRVELPGGTVSNEKPIGIHAVSPGSRWVLLSGWAAAVLLAVALFVSESLSPGPTVETDAGGVELEASPEPLPRDHEFEAYLRKGLADGRVVRELPRLVMDARSNREGGGVEVLFVRQILERAVVDKVYEIGSDDLGRPTPVPVETARLVSYGSF